MRRDDLTLDEALSDPLIGAMMRADGVDPASLRRAWKPLARDIQSDKTSAPLTALLSDCARLSRLAADVGLAGSPRGR
jgi:hypothetical protein